MDYYWLGATLSFRYNFARLELSSSFQFLDNKFCGDFQSTLKFEEFSLHVPRVQEKLRQMCERAQVSTLI